MARARLHPLLEQIRGQLGDVVFKRYGDRVVVSRKPDISGVAPSEAQRRQRARFAAANAYARAAMADPELRRVYAAAAVTQPAFRMAMADFLHPPRVTAVDLSAYAGGAGEVIEIDAEDGFEVTRVVVVLRDGSGVEIESGAAARAPSGRWRYRTQTTAAAGPVHVEATAYDRPGGSGILTAGKTLGQG